MENESSIKEIIRSSLDQVRTIVDADTIVGKQIVTPSGVVIIPISKVSMGFASGGLDLPAKEKNAEKKNFGGGGGTGVTVSPVGFLTVTPDGVVELIPMVPEKTTPIEQIADIIDNAPSVIERIRDIFMGAVAKTATKETDEEDDEEVAELEELYEEKLIQEANEGTDEVVDEAEKILDESELPPSKEELKHLKKEAKERRKQEKKAEKEAAKEAAKAAKAAKNAEQDEEPVTAQEEEVIEVESAEEDPIRKKGKLSDKTIENGIVK